MKNKILSIILSAFMLATALIGVTSMNVKTYAAAITYERDTTWYDASKTILEINDVPDFMEFMYQLEAQGTDDNGAALGYKGNLAAISWTDKMPFEGQTILLNTDIVLNSGITFTSNGPSSTNAYCFVRNSKQIGFGGTFDGQGHTISGLYISSTNGTGGSIFGVAGAATKYPTTNVTVKNLQIKNSYITNSGRGVATIFASAAFNANVRIENVYSNAYLNFSNGTDKAPLMGGLCANVGGKLTIDNCVYAGTMTASNEGATENKQYFGGFVGMTSNRTLSDVYYYGVVNVQASAFYGTLVNDKASLMGKVIGQKSASDANCSEATLTVQNCILAGTMQTKTGTSLGTIAGDITGNTKVYIANTVYTPIKNNSSDITAAVGSKTDSVTVSGSPTKVTDASLVGDKSASGLGNGLDTYWISGTDVKGYPLPMGIVSTFTEESLHHDYVTPLGPSADDLLAELGDKITNDNQYTNSSYSEYSSAYEEIVASINAPDADLGSIDVSTLKVTAEERLVTVEAKRAELLAMLGSKKANNDQYTDESYSQYSADYDAIVESINSAGSDIESINVLALKNSAELKLENIPIPDFGDVTITEPNGSADINISINYNGDLTDNTVYSVDVIWNDVTFTYDAGSVQWDPEKHDYSMLDGKSGWVDSSGEITVVNHSNEKVAVDIVFKQDDIPNGSATLSVGSPSFILDSAVGTVFADAPKMSTEITATGVPANNGNIGKLTVTISRVNN
ncbi:MAG: hypothetical protein E7678_06215 [Ruminococcaceae bacterium]|nr:hypothetical protein [Oscillospiraceae bacterium]